MKDENGENSFFNFQLSFFILHFTFYILHFTKGDVKTVKTENILADKTVDFAVRIVKFYKYLCEEKKEYVLSKQILRSGTSIGANVRESKNAQSKADFISKLNIALKEADETEYWLEVMVKSDLIKENQVEKLVSDLKEIIAILVSSLKTMKSKR